MTLLLEHIIISPLQIIYKAIPPTPPNYRDTLVQENSLLQVGRFVSHILELPSGVRGSCSFPAPAPARKSNRDGYLYARLCCYRPSHYTYICNQDVKQSTIRGRDNATRGCTSIVGAVVAGIDYVLLVLDNSYETSERWF
ncbi:Uncharacterized protein HZ326_29363 [Fusarium oxysporum f. sp. albedinis]|nr:Uncharacterized protein HZ326_29363 [Fusarium oxysporum f. sp. albedinis]